MSLKQQALNTRGREKLAGKPADLTTRAVHSSCFINCSRNVGQFRLTFIINPGAEMILNLNEFDPNIRSALCSTLKQTGGTNLQSDWLLVLSCFLFRFNPATLSRTAPTGLFKPLHSKPGLFPPSAFNLILQDVEPLSPKEKTSVPKRWRTSRSVHRKTGGEEQMEHAADVPESSWSPSIQGALKGWSVSERSSWTRRCERRRRSWRTRNEK